MTAIPLQRDVHYPESDGQPMAESDLHREEMTYLIQALQERFRNAPDVYVAGNLFLYYVQGDPRSVVAPDVFVVQGVSKRQRRVYKLWEEGRAPVLIVEVTSDTTWEEDFLKKRACYEWLGVEEYLLFDPLGDYLSPRLQGFRLLAGRYQRIEPGEDGSIASRTSGVTFRVEGPRLRLVDSATGEILARDEESREEARRERAVRLAAEERARALEEEMARLRRKLERS
jgi:Uma2 family endonuclease